MWVWSILVLSVLPNIVKAQGPLAQALFLGDAGVFNATADNCHWKRGNDRDACPDPDITIKLYTGGKDKRRTELNINQIDWLRSSGFDPEKENIILIHGYAGGDDTLPIVVLRDAYVTHGGYNVFMVDWGVLCQPPCYVAAVHNIKPVAKCLAQSFTYLRNSGLSVDKTTCVGHSLGAHICGLMANFLNFRMERIIGLDPARPLIRPGNANRLDSGDARAVQVMHTNAGYYGETGRVGHVDFCINGGKKQPYCGNTTNVNLCSHIWAICYLAQSIFDVNTPAAEPCSRRCPPGPLRKARNQYKYALGIAIPMGQHTPMNAQGSYCVKDDLPPYCPKFSNGIGDNRCCLEDKLPASDDVVDY